MIIELVMLTSGITYETVLDFTWRELKRWHGLAIDTYKALHGIK